MAKVLPVGQPANDVERVAIAHLRDHLPDRFILLHNFEIERQGEAFEIDLAVLAPHAVYLIDVKGTRGLIDVYGPKWYPDGRAPYPSPLAKLRGHAKTIKGLITQAHPGRAELDGVYVDAVVLLTAPDAHLNDPADQDGKSVVTLKDAARFFQDATRIPPRFSKNILAHQSLILHALNRMKPAPAKLRFGHWEVTEKLGGTDHYTEYRAKNVFAGGARAAAGLSRPTPTSPRTSAKPRSTASPTPTGRSRACRCIPTSSRRATSSPPTTSKRLS